VENKNELYLIFSGETGILLFDKISNWNFMDFRLTTIILFFLLDTLQIFIYISSIMIPLI